MKPSRAKKTGRGAALLLILLLTHAGCVSSSPDPGLRANALPMAPQSSERYQCGPSTLASVLAFHGKDVPEDIIANAIYSPTAKGVLMHDMAWFAKAQGFQADVRTGSVNDLKQAIDGRHPPIVLLDYGIGHWRKPHFTAITGVGEQGVFQLGNGSADHYARLNLFKRLWKRAGNQYLVITPADSPSR